MRLKATAGVAAPRLAVIVWCAIQCGRGPRRRVTRRLAQLELVRKGKTVSLNLQVTCRPFNYGRSSFVLLVLEGLDS